MKELECWSIIDRATIKDLASRGWTVEKIKKSEPLREWQVAMTVQATHDGKGSVAAPNVPLLWDLIQEIEAVGKLSGVARRIYSNF